MSTSSKKNLAQYERLAGTLRDRIAAGIYARGDKLPSEMELMDESGLSRSTVRHALKVLVDEGLVRTERTAGRYVTEDRALIEQLRAEAARNLTAEFLEKMRGIGYGPEQAAALLERWNEKEGTNHD